MYQKTMIIGRLGRDPEQRYTPAGQAVTNFPVATERTWFDKENHKQSETTWFTVTAWGSLAESCANYLKKGMTVAVEGRFQIDPKTGGPRIWRSEDNQMHTSFELVANVVKFLTPMSNSHDGKSVEYVDEDPTINE